MRTLNIITQILLIVGGLNWLLVGLFQFDLVAGIFGGQQAALSRLVYVVVGLCAIVQLFRIGKLFNDDRHVTVAHDRTTHT
jgi:uncharacterized membrane protein YuzA (DUF378 family)